MWLLEGISEEHGSTAAVRTRKSWNSGCQREGVSSVTGHRELEPGERFRDRLDKRDVLGAFCWQQSDEGWKSGCKVDARSRDYSLQRKRGEEGYWLGVGHVVHRGAFVRRRRLEHVCRENGTGTTGLEGPEDGKKKR